MGTNVLVELAIFIFRISLSWGEDVLPYIATTRFHDVITQRPQYKMILSVYWWRCHLCILLLPVLFCSVYTRFPRRSNQYVPVFVGTRVVVWAASAHGRLVTPLLPLHLLQLQLHPAWSLESCVVTITRLPSCPTSRPHI